MTYFSNTVSDLGCTKVDSIRVLSKEKLKKNF